MPLADDETLPLPGPTAPSVHEALAQLIKAVDDHFTAPTAETYYTLRKTQCRAEIALAFDTPNIKKA